MEKIQVVQCLGMRVCLGLAFLLVPSVRSLLLLEAGALLGREQGGGCFWQDRELHGLCRAFPRDVSARQCWAEFCQRSELLRGEMSCPSAPTPPGTPGAHQHQVLPVGRRLTFLLDETLLPADAEHVTSRGGFGGAQNVESAKRARLPAWGEGRTCPPCSVGTRLATVRGEHRWRGMDLPTAPKNEEVEVFGKQAGS